MRRSRIKSRKQNVGQKFELWMIVIVLFGVSIFLGYIGTKYVIVPVLSQPDVSSHQAKAIKPKKPKQDVGVKDTVNKRQPIEAKDKNSKEYIGTIQIQGIKVFGIQVGSFNTMENAQKLIEELKNKNKPSYLVDENGYKIMTRASLDSKDLKQDLSSIKEEYKEAFMACMDIPQKQVRYTKEEKTFLNDFQAQLKNMIQILKDVDAIVKEDLKIEENQQKMAQNLQKLKDIQSDMEKQKPTKEFKVKYDDFKNRMTSLVKGLERKDAKKEFTYESVENFLMEGLYQYAYYVEKL